MLRTLSILMMVLVLLLSGCGEGTPEYAEEELYMEQMTGHIQGVNEALQQTISLMTDYEDSEEWRGSVREAAHEAITLIDGARDVQSPDALDEVHRSFMEGLSDYNEATLLIIQAVDVDDPTLAAEAMEMLEYGTMMVDLAFDLWDMWVEEH